MSETNITITQGTLTVTEYGNAVPISGKVQDLGEHDIKTIVTKALRDDAMKAFDNAVYNQFNATPLRVVPTDGTAATLTLTTNGTATLTNNVELSTGHVKLIVDTLKERNVMPFDNGDYYAIGWPSTFRTMKNSLESVYQNTTPGFQSIVNGEFARYEGCRFVEQTNIAKAAWTNSKSDKAFFFGSDCVAEAVAVPEEIRAKIPTDYGRSNGVAWYYLGGFGLVRTAAADATIICWDSAA